MTFLLRLLRWFFGAEAFVFLLGGLELLGSGLVPRLLEVPGHGRGGPAFYFIARALYFDMLLAGVAAGLAWWRMGRGGAWGRRLALAACVLNLPLPPFGTLAGMVGLVVLRFANLPELGAKVEAARHRPIPGDGTTRWSAGMAATLQAMLMWCGSGGVYAWAHRNGLETGMAGLPWFVWPPVGILISVLAHEAGHFVAGWGAQFRLRGFRVGPFGWKYAESHWRFYFDVNGLLGGGGTSMVPTRPEGIRERAMFFVAGGPVASGLVGLAAVALLLSTPTAPWRSCWEVIAIVAAWGCLDFVTNLLPMATAVGYSDGARLWQLYRRGPWANYLCAQFYMTMSLATSMRPRDWPSEMAEGAANFPARPMEAATMSAMAYLHFEDRGDFAKAEQYVRKAIADSVRAGAATEQRFAPEFAFYEAMYANNPGEARRWLERARRDGSSDYWRAEASVHALEGDLTGARAAWGHGWAIVSRLGPAGVYDVDRRHYRMIEERWLSPLTMVAHATGSAQQKPGEVTQPAAYERPRHHVAQEVHTQQNA